MIDREIYQILGKHKPRVHNIDSKWIDHSLLPHEHN